MVFSISSISLADGISRFCFTEYITVLPYVFDIMDVSAVSFSSTLTMTPFVYFACKLLYISSIHIRIKNKEYSLQNDYVLALYGLFDLVKYSSTAVSICSIYITLMESYALLNTKFYSIPSSLLLVPFFFAIAV